MNPDIDRILVSQEELHEAVKRVASKIEKDYKGKNPLIVGILKGSVLFMSDLIRELNMPLEIDFMAVSSYGGATTSSGSVKILKDLDTSVVGRDVILVEDIVDSGLTIARLIDLFKDRDTKSIRVATLLDKKERRTVDVKADYIGIDIPDAFVVGYGMDYDQQYRGLPYIGVLKESAIKHEAE